MGDINECFISVEVDESDRFSKVESGYIILQKSGKTGIYVT